MALYEPDAGMVRDDGTVAVGLDEVRNVWADLVALGGRVRMVTRYAVESGDIALVSNDWTLEIDGNPVASGATAEVARRQDDGTWRYVVDNPFGAVSQSPGLPTGAHALRGRCPRPAIAGQASGIRLVGNWPDVGVYERTTFHRQNTLELSLTCWWPGRRAP
jgi:ketosteroid isomerase-like protein